MMVTVENNQKKSLSFNELIKNSLLFVPFLVVLGSFYTNGQSHIFGNAYFTTTSYQDTLIQIFIPIRVIVYISAVFSLFVFFSLLCLFVWGKISTVLYVFKYWRKKKLYQLRHWKDQSVRHKTIKLLETYAERLAHEEKVDEKILARLENYYVQMKSWEDRNPTQELIEISEKAISDFNEMLKRPKEADNEDNDEYIFKNWSKFNYNLRHSSFYFLIALSSVVGFIFQYFYLSTIYYSFVFLSVTSLSIALMFVINWYYRNVKTDYGRVVEYVSLFIAFAILSLFMFLLGRDDAQSAIKNSSSYTVVGQDYIFDGKFVASNHSGALVYVEGEIHYLPWNSISRMAKKND